MKNHHVEIALAPALQMHFCVKVHLLWEGKKTLKKKSLQSMECQRKLGDVLKSFGLFRIYEL